MAIGSAMPLANLVPRLHRTEQRALCKLKKVFLGSPVRKRAGDSIPCRG